MSFIKGIPTHDMQLLRNPRFELIPMKGIDDEVEFLPNGATVTVTHSPSKGLDATLSLAERLKSRGFNVIPHISSRSIRDREQVKEILRRLDANGFEEIFVVGGDETEVNGPYSSSSLLILDILEMSSIPKRIGIGAYPDGHPAINNAELFRALSEKQPFAEYMITQICFDQKKITSWLEDMRTRGINLPVYIGIPGVIKRQKLLEISLRVGVGDSTRFLRHNLKLLPRLLGKEIYRPDKLVKHTSMLARQNTSGIAGFHIFTFNQCRATEQWRQTVIRD
jgi:methylenetetrahydrofolate reductase (NADPH)